MNKTHAFLLCLVLLLGQSVASSSEFQFNIGLSYIEGIDDVADSYKDNLNAQGFTVFSADSIPIGLTLQPYVQFDDFFAVGVDIGPSAIITGDRDYIGIPIALMGRYEFGPLDPYDSGDLSLYVKGGVSYQYASGDYVEGSSFGVKGAVGLEFWKTKITSLAVEVAYDSSEVEIQDFTAGSTGNKEIRPSEFTVSLLLMFK